jgi:hypothetical protein
MEIKIEDEENCCEFVRKNHHNMYYYDYNDNRICPYCLGLL